MEAQEELSMSNKPKNNIQQADWPQLQRIQTAVQSYQLFQENRLGFPVGHNSQANIIVDFDDEEISSIATGTMGMPPQDHDPYDTSRLERGLQRLHRCSGRTTSNRRHKRS